MNVFISLSHRSRGFLTVKSNLNQLADKHGPLEIKCPELGTIHREIIMLFYVEFKQLENIKEKRVKSVSLSGRHISRLTFTK